LRALAKKLGLPVLPPSTVRHPVEERTPRARRTSVAWLVAGVGVAALAVAILINAIPGGSHRTNPTDDRNTGPGDPPVPGPVVSGSRDAANVEELLALLKQGVKHLRLTGAEYDLVGYREANGHAVEALLAGDEVRLEGVNTPTVWLGYAPEGKARSKTLTLRG